MTESWMTKKGLFLTIGHLFWIYLGWLTCIEIPCLDDGLYAGIIPPLGYLILSILEVFLFLYYIAREIRRQLGFEVLFGFIGFSPIIPILVYFYLLFNRAHCGLFF
jgi:hypothetical protein